MKKRIFSFMLTAVLVLSFLSGCTILNTAIDIYNEYKHDVMSSDKNVISESDTSLTDAESDSDNETETDNSSDTDTASDKSESGETDTASTDSGSDSASTAETSSTYQKEMSNDPRKIMLRDLINKGIDRDLTEEERLFKCRS